VAFVTGHEDPTKTTSNIAWDKLATAVGTLVFYMGIKNIANITEKLITNGRDPKTPVAVIRWASTPEQRSVVGTLEDIAEVVQREGITPPAVIVVGEVVNLRDIINWYEHRPLFSRRVMVTRTREQASELVYLLENQGAECTEFATISLTPPDSWEEMDQALDQIETFDWLLFTSINAIDYFFQRLFEKDMDSRDLKGLKIAVVGTTTGEILKKYGLKADLLPEVFTGKGLADSLLAQGHGKCRFLLPRAKKAAETLPKALTEAGGTVVIAPAYQNVRPQGRKKELQQELKENRPNVVTFTSSSTFTNFLYMLDTKDNEELHQVLEGIKIAAIGPITAKTIEENGLKVDIMPSTYTIPAMAEAIQDYFSK